MRNLREWTDVSAAIDTASSEFPARADGEAAPHVRGSQRSNASFDGNVTSAVPSTEFTGASTGHTTLRRTSAPARSMGSPGAGLSGIESGAGRSTLVAGSAPLEPSQPPMLPKDAVATSAEVHEARVLGGLARRYLPRHTGLVAGNQVKHLRDGAEAFPAMLEAVASAKESIRLETYIFMDDGVGRHFAQALMAAASRGVRVTVLYDFVGSWRASGSFFRRMREAGVEVRPFRPFRFALRLQLFRRDHRKLLVVDGRIAFTGGLNIADEWAPPGSGGGWRDDVVQLEGPIVAQLERRFSATWWMTMRERLSAKHWRIRRPARVEQADGEVAATVLSSRRAIHRAYLRAIRRAKARVFIAAGYFVPDRRMLKALREAAARGVEVTLLLPERSDNGPVRYASRAFYERLLGWGVRIHLWKDSVLHSKTAVVDGVWSTVGSFNLERTSLQLNHEMNVVILDKSWSERLEQTVKSDCQDCHSLDLETWHRRSFVERLLERVFFSFRKIL